MTREKKELLKKLESTYVLEDLNYSFGELSKEAIQAIEDEYHKIRMPILKRLNELMHGRLNDMHENTSEQITELEIKMAIELHRSTPFMDI